MKAEYIDHMGDDIRVVNAARVSFNKESTVFCDKDAKLISYLARHGHWTPFSHSMVTMRETVPIFVARQRFKHMVGFTYNEVSRRYVDDEPEFFTPKQWRLRPANIKQGSSGVASDNLYYTEYALRVEESAYRCYADMIKDGIAPEQARMVLPQSMYTSYYVTGSLAAWARAYNLRIDPHAQEEIRDLAKQWSEIMAPLFPVSWEALTNESSSSV